MDHLQKFASHVRAHLLAILFINNFLVVGGWWAAATYLELDTPTLLALMAGVALAATVFIAIASTNYLTQPLRMIWQAVLHIAPDTANTSPPDLRQAHLGRELITALIAQVYQIASVSDSVQQATKASAGGGVPGFIAHSLPLPVAVLDANMNILFGNNAFSQYLDKPESDITNQNVYSVLDMSFTNEHTFDAWLNTVRSRKVTASKTWERVRLNASDEQTAAKQFDLVAYYNQGNPEGYEIILTIFDRSRQYAQDDQAMSFVALAVHELRTPLTLLRGYIDVFEEELDGKLDEEMTGFMHKMKAAAQQLAAFTGNVLNVARFENNQLFLTLQDEQWPPLLQSAVADMELRARVRGINLNLRIDDNLPTVGVDAMSIYEVVSNLLDNAIKYSDTGTTIAISTHLTKDNLIETVVRDNGRGIPESAIPNLFDKFYRDHHNRSQVGGTGMGLYLCKAIVTAHGGHIWVQSKEGKGSTFGFTLQPFSSLAEEQKKGDNADIVRTAHGWIKNHSMYRR